MHYAPSSIVVKGNLSATLESIRAANKQSIIRYYNSPLKSSISPQSLENTSLKLHQPAADAQNWSKGQQLPCQDTDRRRLTASLRFGGKSLPFTNRKSECIQKTCELHSSTSEPFTGTGKRKSQQSLGRDHYSRKGPKSNVYRGYHGKSSLQYPHLLASNKVLNDDLYAKYVYKSLYY